MTNTAYRLAAAAGALALATVVTGCSSAPGNTSLYSLNQPVVERSTHTLDLALAGDSLPPSEQRRLADWFEALDLGYGDRLAVDDALRSESVRAQVRALAARHGVLLSDAAPEIPGQLDPGNVRVIVGRSTAHVPGCPDWSDKSAATLGNATSPGFGCAVNSNFAAMVANPEHLLRGERGSGETAVVSGSKAIATWREQAPTGANGLIASTSRESGE